MVAEFLILCQNTTKQDFLGSFVKIDTTCTLGTKMIKFYQDSSYFQVHFDYIKFLFGTSLDAFLLLTSHTPTLVQMFKFLFWQK